MASYSFRSNFYHRDSDISLGWIRSFQKVRTEHMNLKRQFKKIVKISYDTQASLYAEDISMQLGNLEKLLEYLFESSISLPAGRYLDLGCGTGTLAGEIQKKFERLEIIYYGIDLSHKMIKLGEECNSLLNNFIVGNIEYLPFGGKTFDGIISNSALHWLNIPEINQTPEKAIVEAFRILKINGFLAISVSGYGTARQFQESYRKIIGNFQKETDFKAELYREDPIGSMYLVDLVDILTNAGFKIKRAQMDYEPIKYKHPAHYVRDVKAYGYEMYLASIPEGTKEEAWRMIENDFIKKMGHSEYEHDQYMIYVIATKKER